MRIPSRKAIELSIGIVFILNGTLLFLKLLGQDIFLPIPEEILVWIGAIGCFLGGLHMIFIKMKHKAMRSLL